MTSKAFVVTVSPVLQVSRSSIFIDKFWFSCFWANDMVQNFWFWSVQFPIIAVDPINAAEPRVLLYFFSVSLSSKTFAWVSFEKLLDKLVRIIILLE
jgi:hypothetical protein